MKDIVISGKAVKRELWIALGCFIAAVVFDIVGIVKYGKPFVEVFQTIGYEIVIALVIYFCLALVRAVVFLIFRLLGK